MTFCHCDDCGLYIWKKLQKRLKGHECPRCGCKEWYEEDIPKSEVTIADEVIAEKWEAIAREKGLL